MGSHFVLVHGAMHGAWCWYKILHLLKKNGHRVTAIDLKSAGTTPFTADSVNSFDEYNRPLFDFLSTLPQTEKVVIVGHSFGGMSVTFASEAFSHIIAAAVYVCAIMCDVQETFNVSMDSSKEMREKIQYHFGDGANQPPTSTIMPKEFQKDYFYGTSPSWDIALASLLIRPFPMKAMVDIGLKTTEEKFGSVPRIYIRTERDQIFPREVQDYFIASCPPKEVHRFDCDHSPFFSAPDRLHLLLSEIAQKYK